MKDSNIRTELKEGGEVLSKITSFELGMVFGPPDPVANEPRFVISILGPPVGRTKAYLSTLSFVKGIVIVTK